MTYCEAETLLRAYKEGGAQAPTSGEDTAVPQPRSCDAQRGSRQVDAEAAYALYEANLPLIRKIAIRYARIDCAVGLDDLMQEGYLATLEAAQAYADTDKSWPQTLVWALKRRYGQLFPRRRQRMVSLERAPAGALARPDAALTRTENREELHSLAAACGGDTIAQVILAHDLDGESLKSVAERLDLNYTTMCQQRRLALKRMRRGSVG